MTWRILAFLLLQQFLMAEMPLLRSSDGKRTMHAKPVYLVGKEIRFENENGKTFMAKPEFFSAADQEKLHAWAVAVESSPCQKSIQRELRLDLLLPCLPERARTRRLRHVLASLISR